MTAIKAASPRLLALVGVRVPSDGPRPGARRRV